MFSLGITLGARTTTLSEMILGQFKKVRIKGEDAYTYTERIGSRLGASKVAKGGFRSVKESPPPFLFLIGMYSKAP